MGGFYKKIGRWTVIFLAFFTGALSPMVRNLPLKMVWTLGPLMHCQRNLSRTLFRQPISFFSTNSFENFKRLALSSEVSPEALKEARFQAIRDYHPDIKRGEAEKIAANRVMQEINALYEKRMAMKGGYTSPTMEQRWKDKDEQEDKQAQKPSWDASSFSFTYEVPDYGIKTFEDYANRKQLSVQIRGTCLFCKKKKRHY